MNRHLSAVKGDITNNVKIKRVLISVFDKNKLMELVNVLEKFNVTILSTGGTARLMRENGIDVIDVSTYTESPEILDGRVKTLHPKIHGGLLAVRGNDKHELEMKSNGIDYIDMVVMNLYPFEKAVADGGDFDTCMENIDIGGPSMLRSSAKNHAHVTVVTSPEQYGDIIQDMTNTDGCISLNTRRRLASQAFTRSAEYDAAISKFFK